MLLTRNSAADVIAGLRAGADDYVTKRFEAEELRARVPLGGRILEVQSALAARSAALESALDRERPPQMLLDSAPQSARRSISMPGSAPIASK
jgi:PleD family two-component response regulator